MASIYKRDKSKQAPWYIAYTASDGARKVVKGCTDHKACQEIAAKLEADAARQRRGLLSAGEMRFAEQACIPIADHVRDYLSGCELERQDAAHIANKRTQLERLLKEANLSRLPDLRADVLEAHLKGLKKTDLSARSINQHRATAVSFVGWCVDRGRLPSNPLLIVKRQDERQDRRRVRRAMSVEELQCLLAHSGKRKAVYTIAALCGLRRSELGELRWGHLDLENAVLYVPATVGKSKRDDSIPLHPDALDTLRSIRPDDADPTALVFNSVPRVTTFHRDCRKARAAWITCATDAADRERREKSVFLQPFDSEKRRLDLHGLRTTLGTMLARSGVVPQVARLVMRHSDVRLTQRHYTDLKLVDAAAGVAMLPRLGSDAPASGPQPMQATGTTDSAPVAPLIAHASPDDALAGTGSGSGLRLAGHSEEPYTPQSQGSAHQLAPRCASDRKPLKSWARSSVG